MPNEQTAAISDTLPPVFEKRCGDEAADPDPVVMIVKVTGTVVVDEVNVTVEGLKLQMLFGGKLEHIDDVSVPVPVKPFCAENVSTVDPDCPGLAMLIVAGFAVTPYDPPTSIAMTGDMDPLKFASPLYWAVMLSSPSGI